jgi:predicted HTH transcriptional regulator
MNPESVAWLNQFSHIPLDDRQRLALVYLRHNDSITNSEYRRLNRVDTTAAGQELRGLVQAKLVEQKGVGRWTTYTLKEQGDVTTEIASQTDEGQIFSYVRTHGSINNSECRDLLNSNLQRASYLLKKLTKNGYLNREGKGRWTRYRLP